MKGRPRISNAVKRLGGKRDRGGRVIPQEPKGPEGAPDRPQGLSEEAGKAWDRFCNELSILGVLATTDRGALELLARTWGQMADAAKAIERQGQVTGGKVNPHCRVYKDCSALLKALLSEFGLTPGSRSRLVVPAKEHKSTDLMEGL